MINKLKKILVFFAVSLLFFSCNGLFESVSDDSGDDAVAFSGGNYSGIFSGRVENPLSSSSKSSARTIMPAFSASSSDLTYSVYALKNGSGTKIEATSVESDGSYKITVSDSGNYIFYAEISDSDGVLYKGNTDSLSISNGSIVNSDGTTTNEIPTISAVPLQTSSGSGKVAISVDASGTNIGYVKATWTKGSASSTYEKTFSSSDERTFMLYLTSDNSEGSVSSGTYTLSIYFYDDSANKTELYRIQNEVVQIYDGLESKGTFTVTSSLISGTVYVAGSSAKTLKTNSKGENGTYYAPYDSVEEAVNSVIASGSTEMTIYLDGTCTLSSNLSLSSAGKTLNINGLSDADSSVLTGSSKKGIEISAGTVNLKNITVSGFTGTGVYLTNGTLTMESCVISGNGSTGSNGGGIYCGGGSLTLKESKIKGNKAGFGGGIYNMSTLIEVTDCEISDNTSASVIGGGIYNTAKSGTVKFTNCTISKNGGSGATGGGIYNIGALTLSSCKISENTASSAGGGGGIYNSGTLTISGGTISGNSAGNGGGIYTSNSLTVSDSCVIGDSIESSASSSSYSNYAAKNGGGIYISGGTAEISSSTIQRNYAAGTGSNTDKTCNGGGGIYITNSSASLSGSALTITDSKIQYNTATYGGGIYHGFGSVTMTGSSRTSSILSYNSSTNSGAGYSGNLDATSGSDRIAARSLTFTKGTVSNNTSDASGAGMYLKLIGTANISDSDFSGNTAKTGGGALTSAVNTTCTLNNVDITDNSVKSTTSGIGGGLNLQNGTITLTDVSVSGNYGAEGGGIYFSNSSVSVSGKITVSQNYNSSAKSTLNNFYFASSKSSDSSPATSKTFTISSALDSDSKIGVTHSLASGGTQVLTSGWKTYNASSDASSIFLSDDDGYSISTNSDGEVIIKEAGGEIYSSWSALSSAVSDGLSSSETSLSYKIADISDFNNSTIALSGSSKKVSIVPTCDLTITGSSISSAFFTVSDLTATIGNEKYTTTIGDSSVKASLNFIYMLDANLSLEKCVFQNSTANAAINSSGTLSLKNCAFKNITPSETLGTVYVQSGIATIDSCTFTGCENSDIRTKSSGKLVLQGTLSDTSIYIENSTTAGVVTFDTSLSLASGAGVIFTIGSYNSSVKVFASSDGGNISESIRNNSDIMVEDASGNDYTINADGTLSQKDDSAFSSLYTDPKTVSGIPTAGKTYKVSSENDLIYLNTLVDAGNKLMAVTLQQTKDIALSNSWDPIGNSSYAFMGTYDAKDSDGNSHSVTNLNYSGSDNCVGFFAYVSGATIKNLTVSGSISTTGQWAGGIAGYIDGSTTNTFDNCVNNVSITSSKGYAGGIVGSYKVSSGSITITNCYNTGNISCDGTSSVVGYGGIIGYTGSAGTVTVKNCVNIGSVGGNYATGVGGIIGNGDGNRSLENCASTGTITHASSNNNHGAIAGSYNSALKLTHTYYKTGADSYGRAYLTSSTSPIADASGEVISFSSAGALTESETVSSTSYSDVVSALNAWVSANGSDSYRTWTSSDLGL